MLYHPAAAAVSCSECKRWVYDLTTGKVQQRGGKPIPRPAGAETPCRTCPKESPQKAATLVLSRKNRRTFQLYFESRATMGTALGQLAVDPLTRRNLALVDRIVRAWEQDRGSESVGALMASVLTASAGVPRSGGRR